MVGRGSSGSCLEGERGETQAKTGPTLPPKPRAPDRCIAVCWTRGNQWHTCAGWIPAGPPDRGPRARPTPEDHAMPTVRGEINGFTAERRVAERQCLPGRGVNVCQMVEQAGWQKGRVVATAHALNTKAVGHAVPRPVNLSLHPQTTMYHFLL
ncbi:unnamed protein product [Boreogadus saida]